MLELLFIRATTACVQAAAGVLVWRRDPGQRPPALWRRVAVRILVNASVACFAAARALGGH